MFFIKFITKSFIILGTFSTFTSVITFFIPDNKLSLNLKLMIALVFLIINLIFWLYKSSKQINNLESTSNQLHNKYDKLLKVHSELQDKHKALAYQFDRKNVDLDNIEIKYEYSLSLIHNINSMLHYFLALPSKDEKNCIHEIIKYLNNNHIKE